MNNKVALVIGASLGAGRGIATELALDALDGYLAYNTGRSRDGDSTTMFRHI